MKWTCMTIISLTHQDCIDCMLDCMLIASTACTTLAHSLHTTERLWQSRCSKQTVAPGCPAASSAYMGQWFCGKYSLLAMLLPPLLPETSHPHVLCFWAGLPQLALGGCPAPLECLQQPPQLQPAIRKLCCKTFLCATVKNLEMGLAARRYSVLPKVDLRAATCTQDTVAPC